MAPGNNEKRKSKFLSLLLRHRPETLNLKLDAAGWIAIDTLLAALAPTEHAMSADDLAELVKNNDKQRFVVSADGLQIRAAQGHSVQVALGLTPSTPPEVLFHGTVPRFLEAIFRDGLQPMERRQVHLSAQRETAEKVGARRGKPVILIVQAQAMHQQGFHFYQADNGVWLTDNVPPEYLYPRP